MNKFTNAFEIKQHYPESVREEGTTETTLKCSCSGISIFCDSPLERGDKGVCKFTATPPQPLFLEGSLKVAAKGSLI